MATKNKKKFSETKVGKFLGKAAPGILGTVGDVLPDQGVFGIVKNIILTICAPRFQENQQIFFLKR